MHCALRIINRSFRHIAVQRHIKPIHRRLLHLLAFKGDAHFHGVDAAGQVAVIIPRTHAHPAAGLVKGGAGHQHKVNVLRGNYLGIFRNRCSDAVISDFPAGIVQRAGGKHLKVRQADRIKKALFRILLGQSVHAGFRTKGGIGHDILRIPKDLG